MQVHLLLCFIRSSPYVGITTPYVGINFLLMYIHQEQIILYRKKGTYKKQVGIDGNLSKDVQKDRCISSSSSINTFRSVTASKTSSTLDCFFLNIGPKFQQNNRSKLGFLDLEKVDGILNSGQLLVIATVISIYP